MEGLFVCFVYFINIDIDECFFKIIIIALIIILNKMNKSILVLIILLTFYSA
jgi:hypothetical protein